MFFGFTHCPDVCPTTLFEVSEIFRALGPEPKNLRAMFVTVDPERDTPAVMKDYLSSFDPRIVGATGDVDAITAAESLIASTPRRCRPTVAATPWTTPRSSI